MQICRPRSVLALAVVLQEGKELANSDAGQVAARSVPDIIQTIQARDDRLLFHVLQQWLDVSMLYEKFLGEVCQQSSVTFHISTPISLRNTSRKRIGNPHYLDDAAIVTRIMADHYATIETTRAL